jgi:hypothetical protein
MSHFVQANEHAGKASMYEHACIFVINFLKISIMGNSYNELLRKGQVGQVL